MKTARVHLTTIRLSCPHCGELIECPDDGSQDLGADSIRAFVRPGKTWVCWGRECGRKFRIPAIVSKVGT